MATSSSQPQPGDGACNTLSTAHGSGRDQKIRRRRRNNNMLFANVVHIEGGAEGDVEPEQADAGGSNAKSLQMNDNNEKDDAVSSSAARKSAIPRTVVNHLQELSTAAASTLAPTSTQHLLKRSSNYTSQKPRNMDEISQASMARPKKSVPPHLKKVASATEKTASSGGVAIGNGPGRNAGALPNRSKASDTSRGRGNTRGGRGGGNSFAAARAEIPKPDPDRWKTDWNANNGYDSSSVDTGRASSGWGTKKKKRNGETSGSPAVDWSGGLAPPPPDWDSRPGFRVDQSSKKIMEWMGEIESRLCGLDTKVSLDNVMAADGTTYVFCLSTLQPDKPPINPSIRQMGEIVPHYWIPLIIGLQAPQVFWNELVLSNAPSPDHPIDLEGAKPWWELFVKSEEFSLTFLKELASPIVIGIDPDQEDDEQRLKRKHDKGSRNFAENRRRYELERLQEKVDKERRIAEKQRKLAAARAASNTPNNPNRIKPGFKLYVRSARVDDMAAVKDIYNYYIENTISAPEMDRCNKDQMVERYRDIRMRRMPFLVAYKPGGVVKAPRNKKNQTNHPTRDDVQLPDTIVGFALADDYNECRGMYRFTAEIKFYTRDTDYMNGVASCLVDRLMVLLDSTYEERGGYEALGDDINGLDDTVRIIKNVVINLPYEKPERLEWVGRWLGGWLAFKEVGLLENIGTKNGKAVSVAIFQRETGVSLDHGNPPSGFVSS